MEKAEMLEVSTYIDDARYELTKIQNADIEPAMQLLNKASKIIRNYVVNFDKLLELVCIEHEKQKGGIKHGIRKGCFLHKRTIKKTKC